MRALAVCVAGLGLVANLSVADVFFEEAFDAEDWESRWVHSAWKGSNGPAGKFEWSAGNWHADAKESKGIRTPSNMHYHSISAKMAEFSNKGKSLVVQFSVKHEAQEFTFCGGGYIKLIGKELDQANFGGDSPYQIMFGPDICGYDVARIHLIFNWKGTNLLRREDIGLEYDDKNEYTHLYTLELKPDNTYKVYLDLKEKSSGSLHDHWDFPNKTSADPADAKPTDWVDMKKIDNPDKKKPDDWVDEHRIRDPEASVPEEWDEEEDGTWEAPMIDNPQYKGAWTAGQIDNPAYMGPWTPRQLDNPEYVEDVYVYDFGYLGFELWTVNNGSVFDNILVCDSFEHAKTVGAKLQADLFSKEKDAKKAYDKEHGKDTDAGTGSSDSEDDYDDEMDMGGSPDKEDL